MIQLTFGEREAIRARAARHPELVAAMKESVRALMEEPVLVPSSGIANWHLYYFCPKCSVELAFDRHDGRHHRCPQCGTVYTGEPYDSTWWGEVNSRNYNGALTMGWLYVMTGEAAYARRAGEILSAYAAHYPDYEVHGNIPYNGPGRVGAQTLDEANFQRTMAITYDLIAETMADAEKDAVRDRMFLPGARFLMEHRHNQLHNHEVIIDSAIAVIGLIFGRQELVDFAVYQPYGLLYQLEHGMLENGMWFEGSFGYHFYALASFLAYEKFALHTAHSHIAHPNYRKMMDMAYDYLMPNGALPLMGDTMIGHMRSSILLYEFTYRELRSEKMLAMLRRMYESQPRDSLEALVYGVEELPAGEIAALPERLHPRAGHSGHVILHGPQGRCLLLKCDRYGGEHDHYDRLGINYWAFGQPVAPDLGTTGYGALLHYDYYKNTGSHNTVTIGEENQPPANAVLTRFEEKDDVVYLEAVCDWAAPYEKLDSFTIAQWDEEAYRSVKMTRRIAWTRDFFAELFLVEGVTQERTIDWVMHLSGERAPVDGETPVPCLSEKKPFKHIHDVTRVSGEEAHVYAFEENGVVTRLHSAAFGGETFLGTGLNNPSYKPMQYLIERVKAPRAMFAHVVESGRDGAKLGRVAFEWKERGVRVEVTGEQGRDWVIEL